MSDNYREKGKDFWNKVAKVAAEGRVPYIQINSPPVKMKDLPFGRKKALRPDPERRWSHFRTRSQGGRAKPLCLARGCHKALQINDLLCCSEECGRYLEESCREILRILKIKPEFVYTDFLKGVGLVRVSRPTYTEKDDELEGLDGNRYRGFSRRDTEGPGVGIVREEEIPSTHLLVPRRYGNGRGNPWWAKGLPRVASSTPRVRSGASEPTKGGTTGQVGGTSYAASVDRSKR